MTERQSFTRFPPTGEAPRQRKHHQPICKFFESREGCRKGQACPFSHHSTWTRPLSAASAPFVPAGPLKHDPQLRPQPSAVIPVPTVIIKTVTTSRTNWKISKPAQKPKEQRDPKPKKGHTEFFLDFDRLDSAFKSAVATRFTALAAEDGPEVSVILPSTPEIILEEGDLLGEHIVYPKEELFSDCTGFELWSCLNQHGRLRTLLSTDLTSAQAPVLNSFVALGPESYLKVEELAQDFSRMLPSIQNGWTQFRGIRGQFAGCGRTSQVSEALSFETVSRLTGATLLYTEMEITYSRDVGVPKIDYVVLYNDIKIGISVTRAVNLRSDKGDISALDAYSLLEKKLASLQISSRSVKQQYQWDRNMLHVWSPSMSVTKMLIAACEHLQTSPPRSPLVSSPTSSSDSDSKPSQSRFPIVMITTTSFPCPPAYSYIYGKE